MIRNTLLGCSQKIILVLGILLLFVISKSVFAAAPVTHAVLAKKWMTIDEHYNDQERASFILGTLFPDIRYLGVIERNKTHEKNVTVDRLKANQNPFIAGMWLHAFVDMEREKYVVKHNIYQKIAHVPGQQYKAMFLKLLEDEILFSKENWQDVRRYLTKLDPEEQKFEISDKDLDRWHKNQTRAFTFPPSVYLQQLVQANKGMANVPKETIDEWSKLLPKMSEEQEMQDYVNNLVKEFDVVFSHSEMRK